MIQEIPGRFWLPMLPSTGSCSNKSDASLMTSGQYMMIEIHSSSINSSRLRISLRVSEAMPRCFIYHVIKSSQAFRDCCLFYNKHLSICYGQRVRACIQNLAPIQATRSLINHYVSYACVCVCVRVSSLLVWIDHPDVVTIQQTVHHRTMQNESGRIRRWRRLLVTSSNPHVAVAVLRHG